MPIAGLFALGSLGMLSAVARMVMMAQGSMLDELPKEFDGPYYLDHVAIALAHLIPGVVFMLLGPLQFSTRLRQKWPRWHRISGRIFVLCSLSIGGTAIWMNEYFPKFGGFWKYSSNFLFGAALIVCMVVAMWAIYRRDIPRHRAWMMRGYAVGLGVATQRLLLMPVFLAVGMPSEVGLNIGIWAGWLSNLAVAEYLLRRPTKA